MKNYNIDIFFDLIRSGLWGEQISLSQYGEIDFNIIKQLSSEQTIIGLIAAGLENVIDNKAPRGMALALAGEVLQIEQRNTRMNVFIADLIERMGNEGIYALLVKGQGLAQCYNKPLWRSCGDVDLLLSHDNYEKAKDFLLPLSSLQEIGRAKNKHIGMIINGWNVELHWSLRSALWRRLNKTIDNVQTDVFYGGKVRSWLDGKTQVFLPGVDQDVFFVFAHILQHFYNGGIGLRQVCDWVRLVWTYKDNIDKQLLGKRLKEAKIETEWKAFGAFAVRLLGMPKEYMPFYDNSRYYEKKMNRICKLILESGNFGHNKNYSHETELSGLRRKVFTFIRFTKECANTFIIFPSSSIKIWLKLVSNGLGGVFKKPRGQYHS